MRKGLINFGAAIVIINFVTVSCFAQSHTAALQGDWVGGFWFKTHWVRVNIRFDDQPSSVKGTANVVFSSYEGTNGAEVTAIRFEPPRLSFDIPITSGLINLSGHLRNDTIAGRYSYVESSGVMGLTRVASVDPKSLARVYGLYRLAPNKIIAIGQDFD